MKHIIGLSLAVFLGASSALIAQPLVPQAVRVTESDGVVVPVWQDVASVLVANPEIANVQPLSDRSLFLYGKSVGSTKLFVLNADDEIVLEQRVVVTQSLQHLDSLSRSAISREVLASE